MDQFLTPEEWNIDNLFKGKYIIPIYQRPYSWGENEVKQLLKDIYLSYQLFIASQSGDTSVKNDINGIGESNSFPSGKNAAALS